MNQIISLGPIPAHIANASRRVDLASNAMAGVRQSYPRLDFHPNWAVRWRGEKTVIEASPGLDARTGKALPASPVPTVDVVIVGISSKISKRFYLSGYDPKREGEAPDCFSTNGEEPDAGSRAKQSPVCVTCPHNKWGSKVTDAGTKIKACQDRRKIAVVPAPDIENEEFGGPMILDLPPTGMLALDRYAREVRRHGADPSQIVTTLGKDQKVIHQITFAIQGFIPDPRDFERAVDFALSDEVRAMLEEETAEVTADIEGVAATEAHPLAHRPPHVAAALAATPKEKEPPTPPPAAQAEAPTASPKPSPFSKKTAQEAPAAVREPAQETVHAAAEGSVTTVVQGTPKEMHKLIENLLGC